MMSYRQGALLPSLTTRVQSWNPHDGRRTKFCTLFPGIQVCAMVCLCAYIHLCTYIIKVKKKKKLPLTLGSDFSLLTCFKSHLVLVEFKNLNCSWVSFSVPHLLVLCSYLTCYWHKTTHMQTASCFDAFTHQVRLSTPIIVVRHSEGLFWPLQRTGHTLPSDTAMQVFGRTSLSVFLSCSCIAYCAGDQPRTFHMLGSALIHTTNTSFSETRSHCVAQVYLELAT